MTQGFYVNSEVLRGDQPLKIERYAMTCEAIDQTHYLATANIWSLHAYFMTEIE
jgi:hypothetical protein